jgi:hypothetical protein
MTCHGRMPERRLPPCRRARPRPPCCQHFRNQLEQNRGAQRTDTKGDSDRFERALSIHHPHRTKIQSRWKVFTVIYRPTPLLLHFVRHYAALGFTDIVIAASTLCADIDWDAIRTAAGDAEIHVEPLLPRRLRHRPATRPSSTA